MGLSEKLRAAAGHPSLRGVKVLIVDTDESCDVPGLLEDAANFVDATLQTCQVQGRGLEALKNAYVEMKQQRDELLAACQQPLAGAEMVEETASRR